MPRTFNLTDAAAVMEYKRRFLPGIYDCEIISVSLGKNKNEKEFISVIVTDLTSTMEHEEQMFVSTDKGTKATMTRLQHLFEAVYGKNNFPKDNVTIDNLNASLAGRRVRIKFGGEKYDWNGEERIRVKFPFLNFAESSAVPRESSSLTFNADRDVKDQVKFDSQEETVTTPEVSTVPPDMPF